MSLSVVTEQRTLCFRVGNAMSWKEDYKINTENSKRE